MEIKRYVYGKMKYHLIIWKIILYICIQKLVTSIGLDKEFADAIDEFFKEYLIGKLPSGIIEIFGGAFDEVGSSNIAFKKAINLLVFVFQHIDELFDDNELQCELFNLI